MGASLGKSMRGLFENLEKSLSTMSSSSSSSLVTERKVEQKRVSEDAGYIRSIWLCWYDKEAAEGGVWVVAMSLGEPLSVASKQTAAAQCKCWEVQAFSIHVSFWVTNYSELAIVSLGHSILYPSIPRVAKLLMVVLSGTAYKHLSPPNIGRARYSNYITLLAGDKCFLYEFLAHLWSSYRYCGFHTHAISCLTPPPFVAFLINALSVFFCHHHLEGGVHAYDYHWRSQCTELKLVSSEPMWSLPVHSHATGVLRQFRSFWRCSRCYSSHDGMPSTAVWFSLTH